jgi:cyclase
MRNAIRSVSLLPLLAALGCGGYAAGGPSPSGDDAAVLRTADPYKRGYTDQTFPRVKQLADGVYTYEQLRSAGDEKFTTVSLFVVTSEGVLVADGQGSVEETQRMVNTIRGITTQPIRHVVIASDHGDHTAGNSAFPKDAVFYAHPTSAATLRTSAAQARPGSPPVILPTEMVPERRTLDLGGKEIQILFLGRAHTGGDLSVYLPREKVLFMSEAYLNRVFPAMRSAYPSEWVAVIDRAKRMDVNYFVPGHGFVDSPAVLREELDRYQQALRQVIAEARRLHAAGVPVEEAVKQANFGELGGWSLYSSQREIAIRRVYAELNGQLTE